MESPISAFNPHPTLGAMEVGVTISSFLFGVVTLQTILYFERFPKDLWILKSLIALLWMLELGHAICVSHATYIMTITDYGNPLTLVKTPTSLNASVILSGGIGFIVQSIFAERVHRFSGKIYIPIFCWTASFLRFLGSFVIGIQAIEMKTVLQFEEQSGWLIQAVLSISAGVDVTIAASLCYYLREKRDTTFQSTVRLIDTLSKWAIETGLVTSLAAISVTIAFGTMKGNFIWIALYTLLARCFSNSLLATLNARARLRSNRGGNMLSALQSADSSEHRGGVTGSGSKFSPAPIQIAIETTKTQMSAGEYYDMEAMSKEGSYGSKAVGPNRVPA